MKKLILLSACLLSSPAFAGVGSYCVALGEVKAGVNWCWQNSYYDDAASRCLEKFEAEVKSEQIRLSSSFRQTDRHTASAQDARMANSGKNLSQTDSSFQGLLARARKARAELVAYTQVLILPGNPGVGFAEGLGVDQHLRTFSCHQEPLDALKEKIARIDKKIAELEGADKATLALHKSTSGYQAGLDQFGERRSLQKGVAPSRKPAAAPRGKAKRSGSTITGDIRPEPKY